MARGQNNQQTAGWTPAVFQGEEWSPTPFDYSIMERSLARQEERQNKATQQATAVDAALADIEKNLHNDPKTNQWWADYKSEVKQKIQDYANVGDWQGALNMATQMAGEVATDSAVIGRLEANKNYKAWTDELQKRVDAGKISKDTRDYFLENNKFNYEDKFDSDGNIVRGDTYENLDRPVDDINVDDFIVKAFKLCTARKPESSNFRTTTTDGTTTGSTQEYVDAAAIRANLREIFELESGVEEALHQRWKVEKAKYRKLQREADANLEDKDAQDRLKVYRERLGKNLGTLSFEDYVIKLLGNTAISNNLAYNWKTKLEDLDITSKRGAVTTQEIPLGDGRVKVIVTDSEGKKHQYIRTEVGTGTSTGK